MEGSWARIRAAERVEGLGAAGLADRDLRREVLAVLRGVLDFAAYVWLLTDPVTEVGTAPLAEVPCLAELPTLIRAKYAAPVNRWTALRRQASPAGLLSRATDDELAESRAWRELLGRYRIRDVASVVFADHHGCWGFSTCGATTPRAASTPPTPNSSPVSPRRWPARCAIARHEPSPGRPPRTSATPGRSC